MRGSRKLVVDGVLRFVGRGDPGRAADGEHNNCLIDSLRQCAGLSVDRKLVRRELAIQFGDAFGRAKVTTTAYLDVESHWQAILLSLFRHNASGLPATCETRVYCVIALYANSEGNGIVLGNLRAPNRLVFLNDSGIHCDPCLPL